MRKFICTFIAATALLLFQMPAQAKEPYIVGNTWGVLLSVPKKLNDAEGYPTCELSTRAWDNKRLTFLYKLTSATYIELWLQVRKDGWDLPLARKTKVALIALGVVIEYELSADSDNTLTGSIDQKVVGNEYYVALGSVLGLMLDARRSGLTMNVRFAGNEPEWSIPAMDQSETYQVQQAIDRCLSKLRSLGSDFYAADGRRQNGPTSPFAE